MGAQIQPLRTRGSCLQTLRWSGPPFSEEILEKIKSIVTDEFPDAHGLPGHLWNVKKVKAIVFATYALACSRTTVWKQLRRLDLSWQKTKKTLSKANTAKREAYIEDFKRLYEEMIKGEITLIYVDELHIHQDLDLGYGWNERGQPFRIPSTSPGLSKKVNWYGAYDFTNGEAFIWAYPKCNGENTCDFLDRMAEWLKGRPRPTIIWDGSPVHRAKIAMARARELKLEIKQLPGYSPDLNPIECLWKWMREEVTYGYCHESVRALFDACKDFIERINLDPLAMIQRLWPKIDLIPEEEKLRISK